MQCHIICDIIFSGDSMQTQRLFEILYILLQKRKTTAKALAQHFEVSIRTIYRDLDVLTLAGIPVYTQKGRLGGIFLHEDYILNKSLLSDEEQQKILSALHSQQVADQEDVSELLQKLSATFQKPDTPWVKVDFTDWCDTKEEDTFQILKQAILSHHVITFQYHSSNASSSLRTVEPLQLLFKGQSWYLVGYCHRAQEQRTFKIKRMRCIQQTGQTFTRALKAVELHYEQYRQAAIPLVLRFAKSLSYRLWEEYPLEAIQELEDCYILQISLPENDMLYGMLLSYGDGLQVLHPEHIKGELKKRIQKMLDNYNKADTGCQY